MRRTRSGLTITNESGVWRTVDGQYEISQVNAITFCDRPHPERHRDTKSGLIVGGYCPGDEEHDYIAGWGLYDVYGHEVIDDVFPGFNEAHEALAKHLRVS